MKDRLSILFKIIGQHTKRHSILLFVILSAMVIGGVAITLGWYFSPDEVDQNTEISFYVAQSLFFLATAVMIVLLILTKKGKFKDFALAIFSHIYAAFLLIWSTYVFCFDLSLGFSPLLYLIIVTLVAGILVVDPFFYGVLMFFSLIPIIITIINVQDIFFGGYYIWENIVLFVIFLIFLVIISFRNYHVVYNDYRVQKILKDLSYKDELTGLLNERSYVDYIDELDKRLSSGEDVKFAVIVMDVNNLKATNDKYGHRYGCSLVVHTGAVLPTIFHTSKLFHVGGDEFIAIVEKEDLENFEETMKKFDEEMLYSMYTYEGVELIFSVARGYHIRKDEKAYKEVMQVADQEMYINKKYLKEKYHMASR